MSPELQLLDAGTVFHNYVKKLLNKIVRQAQGFSPFFPLSHHAAFPVGIGYRRGLMHFQFADFARYLYPVLMANAVCGGLVAGLVWEAVAARVARRRESRRPAAETSSLTGEPLTT